MEHTKKFVLMDPRFVRPSMRDKVLSVLDSDISTILNSEDSDEAKAKNYAATLSRFRNYSTPPPKPDVPKVVPSVPSSPVTFKASPPPRKRVRRAKQLTPVDVSSIDWDQLVQPDSTRDAPLWRRTNRVLKKKKQLGSQWTETSPKIKKKKTVKRRKTWIQY